jgi:hypothetical protein
MWCVSTYPQQRLSTLQCNATLLECPLWHITGKVCEPVPGGVGAVCREDTCGSVQAGGVSNEQHSASRSLR